MSDFIINSPFTPHPIRTIPGQGGTTLDAWGTQKSVTDHSLFRGIFTFEVPKAQWILYEDGSEVSTFTAATSVGGGLNLSSNSNESILFTRRHNRYQPNRGQHYAASIILPDPTADGVRDFGMFTSNDGIFFRLKSDGLYAVRVRNGELIQEEAIETHFDIDFSKGNIYDIQAQLRGVGWINFFIGNPITGYPELVHTFKLLNTDSEFTVEDMALPVAFRCTNVTEDVVLKCGCVDLSSEGGRRNTEVYSSAYSESVSISTDTPVLIIRQPGTINSKENTRDISLVRATFICDKKSVFKVWTTRDPIAITGATFKKAHSETFIETDSPNMDPTAVRATAIDTAKMRLLGIRPVLANTASFLDNPSPDTIEVIITRGDYVVITGTASTGTADVSLEWGEEV